MRAVDPRPRKMQIHNKIQNMLSEVLGSWSQSLHPRFFFLIPHLDLNTGRISLTKAGSISFSPSLPSSFPDVEGAPGGPRLAVATGESHLNKQGATSKVGSQLKEVGFLRPPGC